MGEVVGEIIKFWGAIDPVNILRETIDKNSAARKELRKKETFPENSPAGNTRVYSIGAANNISEINGQLKSSIKEINDLKENLNTLIKLAAAVDEIAKVAAKASV
jgi:hypothetical protein